MDLGLKGKKALVCGASQGMGLAMATALSHEGADVFMCARTPDKLADAAKGIQNSSKGKVEHFACDLSNHDGREKLIEAVKAKFGSLDILIHNSGGPSPTTAEDTTAEMFSTGFESLFQSVVHLNHAFVPAMKERKWGRILNVTSLSVVEPIPNLAVSNAIESAATALFKTLADELAKYEITVNSIAPGSISTGRVEELIEARAKKNNVSQEQYKDDYIKAIPMGRMGSPDEFAAVACFLCSTQASYVTGSTICIDGGRRRSTW